MDNFKLATREKVRFQTNKGLLSTEQLWDLTLNDLDALAVSLDEEHKQSGKKSFLVKKSVKDKTAKLKFDVVIEILNAKADEAQALSEAKEKKAHNDKIITLISEKKDENLKKMSVKELQKMIK